MQKSLAAAPRRVRKELTIPAEIDLQLVSIAKESGTTTAEVVHKAISLYIAVTEKKQQGLRLGFARQEQMLEIEVIGL